MFENALLKETGTDLSWHRVSGRFSEFDVDKWRFRKQFMAEVCIDDFKLLKTFL